MNRDNKFVKDARDRLKENFDNRHSWTIYFLVDLKLVYIMTYAFITIVNLISSTANSEAFSDRDSMMPLNVSLQYMSVNVTSINDAILWNCRRLSETKDYYKFLYWMLMTAVIVALVGFFLIKFITLITISSNFGGKWCNCRCSTFKYGLTKLWQIALCKHLMNPTTDCAGNLVKSKDTAHSVENSQLQSVVNSAEGSITGIEHHTDLELEDLPQLQSSEGNVNKDDFNRGQASSKNSKNHLHHCDAKCYQKWLDGDIPDDVAKELGCFKNFLRQLISYALLVLLVTLMCLAYLSFDLHPLACITDEELITYDHEKNSVELRFSNQLSDYWTAAGYLFFLRLYIFSTCENILLLHHIGCKRNTTKVSKKGLL